MSEGSDRYISLNEQPRLRRQAWKVVAAGSAVAALWLAAIILAPAAAAAEMNGISNSVYSFFGHICHQLPERSFFILEHQFAVCSRCFGVYFGLLAGMLTYPLWRPVDSIDPLPRFWLFLSLVPITIDWSLGFFEIWENNHASRFLTGLILGVACAVFIIPALVEIVRNLQKPARQ